jgi:tetratricopeptide (TPR) repeat protein
MTAQSQKQKPIAMTMQQGVAQAAKFYAEGKLARAETICRKILKTQPRFHPAWYQLGLIAVKVGKLQQALEYLHKAAKLSPKTPAYFKALGEVCRRLGRFKVAVNLATRAAEMSPVDAEIRYNLGLALADTGNNAAAAEQYRRALAINPAYGLAANNLGTVLERAGDVAAAERAYALAVDINPRHAEAQNNLGAILSARSDLAPARACFEAAIAAKPSFVHSHFNLSTLKKYTPEDPHLAALEEVATRASQMSPEERLRLCFALGKALEDVGRYEEAFTAYAEGNKLKRATFKYDEEKMKRTMADVVEKFDAAFAKKDTGAGCADSTPVFIVGMPRSGTTLLEQILSSHSGLHGAGELKDFSFALDEVRGSSDIAYIDWLLQADAGALSRVGENYIRKLRGYNATALRITDKMPGNFFYVGLIHKALPNAKIIHATRNPMDVCLSNYSRLFNETMPFAYDLVELGHYYRSYKSVMEHWKRVLPPGTILEVSYEEVVGDLEGQARRVIDYCGLPWEDACLAFHKNERPVKTASVAQVRQPIYKSSVERWENFKTHLTPLQQAINGEI